MPARSLRYTVDCRQAKDLKLSVADFVEFLRRRFKVNHRTGKLGTAVTISSEGDDAVVIATHEYEFPKRYVKYLTKKYLSADYRGIFRVLATGKSTFALRPYVADDEDADNAE